MRLPSLGDVVTASVEAAKRFPFVIGAGVIAAYAAIGLVESDGNNPGLLRLLAAASLGLPFFFALTVTAERRASAIERWLIPAAGLLALAGFWYAWPSWTGATKGARYLQLSATFHLFVAFAPFIGRREPNAFWHYNRILFTRFLTTAIFTGVLWLGVSGALLALDKLLGVDVPPEGYARLWMVLALVFNPWFFVGGVPRDLGLLEGSTDYPRGLRVFTQYVLVPIVAVYLLILTVYLGKVMITRIWPSGWIGYLVSGVAGVGIFAWLLIHPLEERAEYAWVKAFTRGFYVALMPSIAMLWLAIWKRVDQYGITEARYTVIVLSVWLALTAVYYAFSRSRNILLIPASLCALGALSFAGPWGAYAVSRGSQTRRLETVLARNRRFADGGARADSAVVSPADEKEIGAGFRYLLEMHGTQAVRPLLSDSVARKVGALREGTRAGSEASVEAIVKALGVRYLGQWNNGSPSGYVSYSTNTSQPVGVRIEGYTYALHVNGGSLRDSTMIVPGVHVRIVDSSLTLVVTADSGRRRLLDVPLQPMLDSIARYRVGSGQLPQHLMTIEAHQGGAGVLARLTQLGGTTKPQLRITSIVGDFYFKVP